MKLRISREALQARPLFVATPIHDGRPNAENADAVENLKLLMASERLSFGKVSIINESHVDRARNLCVEAFLRCEGMTHMLFVDADVEFKPEDAIAMLALADPASDKDVICGIYPKKRIRWENIVAAVRGGLFDEADPADLARFGGDFVFNPEGVAGSFPLDELLEVREAGTGFMMIQRRVFDRFREAYPERNYIGDGAGMPMTSYFSGGIDPESRRWLSEDYNFCHMIRTIGCKVWVAPWIKLNHIGAYKFVGDPEAVSQLAEVSELHRR